MAKRSSFTEANADRGQPSVDPATGIKLLEQLISKAEQLMSTSTLDHADVQAWNNFARSQMTRALGEGHPDINSVLTSTGNGYWMDMSEAERLESRRSELRSKVKLVWSSIESLKLETAIGAQSQDGAGSLPGPAQDRTPGQFLERLLDRFHRVARQLRNRQRGRAPFVITDEYDVQDLLHALLRLEFDDVRPEENTPSYAGGGSRMDFLLKNESIVVEAKCTRENLRDKEVGEELLVDIAKYKQHSDCKELVCFVYDPLELIRNPHALEADLSRVRDDLPVKVFVRPRH